MQWKVRTEDRGKRLGCSATRSVRQLHENSCRKGKGKKKILKEEGQVSFISLAGHSNPILHLIYNGKTNRILFGEKNTQY